MISLSGRMQIKLLSANPPRLQRKQSIYALHGPNAATELAMLATVSGLDPTSLPVLPALLKATPTPCAPPSGTRAVLRTTQLEPKTGLEEHTAVLLSPCLAEETAQGGDVQSKVAASDLQVMSVSEALQADGFTPRLDEDSQRIAAEFALNPEQAGVLQHCSMWAADKKVKMPGQALYKCCVAQPLAANHSCHDRNTTTHTACHYTTSLLCSSYWSCMQPEAMPASNLNGQISKSSSIQNFAASVAHHALRSGWPSGLRRQTQVLIHVCGRGFKSHL